ncbi:hypothetical protein E1281_02765 [Actinomadura sp. KC345]|uniref:hypothetical protein n=1 Tax=Actinomadura sp. KC345 TaxID=2530371 RepID=UPI0010432ECA|nr:hypothetical protein [Actinomadura sp. KC345]TDC58118.1 hypothetical protein E1281_02765 [Actinomadura sp. KC345]
MKRGHIAVVALTLALAGCGGSDGGDSGGGSERTGAAGSPAAAPSSGASGTGKPDAPTPPAHSKAAKAFSDCMRKQGVELPTLSPNPSPQQSSTVSQQELKKRMAAIRTCMKTMAKSPGLR